MNCNCGLECKPANEILEALDLLHRTYPEERVEIWAGVWPKVAGKDGIYYHIMVGDVETVWVHSATSPMQGALQAIEKAGDRSRATIIARRIAALKKEMEPLAKQLADLEAK